MTDDTIIDPKRQIALTAIIKKLHAGSSVAEVKKDFATLIQGVSAAEIAAMEQALIDGGMPVEEVQRLCEVHVEVFESSLAKGEKASGMPGHPIHSFMEENKIARKKASALLRQARALAWGLGQKEAALSALEDLSKIIIHYARKENQLFPYLEKHGFTGPSRVMWGKHDEIRELLSKARGSIQGNNREFLKTARSINIKIKKMIFMEEHILIPESSRRLSEREWAEIRNGEEAIGFAWIQPASMYDASIAMARMPQIKPLQEPATAVASPAYEKASAVLESLNLSTGTVPKKTLDIALKTLPIDISIVDENDRVLYYSDAAHRIFPRSPAVIGRSVQNCHPQKSVDTVNKILATFKNGEKDKARFWIEMGGKFILIEYYALRDENGDYLGTLEVSQDLTELRALTGQRRLLDWGS
jgi:hypothetical protein